MTNPKRNIFVVLSPLQLICAQEARETFCANEQNHLVIIDRRKPGTVEHMQKEQELDEGWHLVSRHREPPRRSALRNLIRIKNTCRILLFHGAGKGKVFLGDPYIGWLQFLGKILGTEVTWLDDGAATINVIHNFQKRGLLQVSNETTPKLFTLFSNDVLDAQSNGAVKQNKLDLLRASRSAVQTVSRGKAVFIGQWLGEQGIIDVRDEIEYLKAVKNTFQEYDMEYVCHRHESKEKIFEIERFMQVVTYPVSIERQFLEANEVPSLVISWYSTALFTLRNLFPDIRFVSVEIPVDDVALKDRENIARVYDALRATTVEVLGCESLSSLTSDI